MNIIKKLLFTLCISILAIASFIPSSIAYAANNNVGFENISLSNAKFDSAPNSTTLDSKPTGWDLIKNTSTAKTGIINVESTKFNSAYTTYFLNADENPGKKTQSLDNKVLMLNARNSSTGSEIPAVQGYKTSKEIELEAYSFYTFSILAKTINNAKASIYITGLDETVQTAKFENIEAEDWTEYQIFLSTGATKENVNVELWLGKKDNGTSSGAVFFDDVAVSRYTQKKFQTELNNADNSATDYEFTSAQVEINTVSGYENLDFEKGSLVNWENTNNEFPENATADIVNIKDNADLGSDNTANNTYALVLSTENAGFFGYEYKNISLPMHAIYKITANVKVKDISGNAYIILKENNDVNEFYNKNNPSTDYTPVENEIKISSNTTNIYINDYTTCSFYILGNPNYPTSFNLQLWLGQDDDKTTGTVAFDTIKIESISYEDYNTSKSDDKNVKVDLTTTEVSPSITNGNFNLTENSSTKLEYPLLTKGWSELTEGSEANVWGTINTYSPLYESIKGSFGNKANPGNPKYLGVNIPTDDTNNMLMVWNKGYSSQKLSSPSFNVDASKYYNLSFSYKTISDDLNEDILNIYIVDNNNVVLYEKLGLNSKNESEQNWKDFVVTIRTAETSKTLNLIIELGTTSKEVSGIAYFDNLELTEKTYSNEEYENMILSSNILDFTNAGFNLVSSTTENDVYNPLAYTKELEKGSNPQVGDPVAFGGLINSENNSFNLQPNEFNTNIIKNTMLIKTNGPATYSLTAKDKISLTENTYYKFTVYVKTRLPQFSGEKTYGAEFSLEGTDAKITNILCENFVAYNIYVEALKSADVNVRFALESDSLDNTGFAFFDSFSYEKIEKADYTFAKANDVANSTFFTLETEEEEPETTPESKNNFNWLIIPSLLFGIALVLAIVAYAMKKVKFKKIDVKRKSTYDRDKTMHRDVIRKEAEDRQKAEIKKIEAEISTLQAEIEELETSNKERIQSARREHGKQITRADEKEFKLYANKHTKLLNKADRLKEVLETVKSSEYLLKEMKKIRLENKNKKFD